MPHSIKMSMADLLGGGEGSGGQGMGVFLSSAMLEAMFKKSIFYCLLELVQISPHSSHNCRFNPLILEIFTIYVSAPGCAIKKIIIITNILCWFLISVCFLD